MARSPLARVLLGASLLMLIIALAARWRTQVTQALPISTVIPTNEWVNFFSADSTYFGSPVPVGAVVAAFDEDGPHCGEFTVTTEGEYGVMPCYRDEKPPFPTPDLVDEGADPGDVISFSINGLPATPVPRSLNGTPVATSTTITWTSHGDLWEVDLHVVATPTPTATPSPTPTETATPTATATHTATATAAPAPVLAASKSDVLFTDADGNGVVSPGDTLEYTVTLVNSGNADATGVIFQDTPDPNTTLVIGSVQTTQGAVTSGNNAGDTTIAVDIGTIPGAGRTVTTSFKATINEPFPAGVTQISNQGLVASDELPLVSTDDPELGGETDPTITGVTVAQLVSGIPVVVRRNQGLTTRMAIQNVNPNPGFTDYRLDLYDQNGFIDGICGKLNEKQVEYIDLELYSFLPDGFSGTAVLAATGSTQVGGPGLAVLAVVLANAPATGDRSAAYEGFPLSSTYLPPQAIRCDF